MVGKPEVWADGRIDKLLRRSHRGLTGSVAWCVPLFLVGNGWCGFDPIGETGWSGAGGDGGGDCVTVNRGVVPAKSDGVEHQHTSEDTQRSSMTKRPRNP